MHSHSVDVFFYCSYMSFDVLAEASISERPHRVASLPGFKLVISPLANLVRDRSSVAFGMVTRLDHRELDRLYSEHARERLGGVYLPEAVLVFCEAGLLMPALTYVSCSLVPAPPAPEYVERILRAARVHGFPSEYRAHIESFGPTPLAGPSLTDRETLGGDDEQR